MPGVLVAATEFNHLIGQSSALMAAVTWATALVLFKRSGEHIEPIALNLFKNAIALVCLTATLAVGLVWAPAGALVWQGPAESAPEPLQNGEIALLLLSGIVGIALADTLVFAALRLTGVGLLTIAECTYTPFMVLFSWVLLSEQLGWVQGAGVVLILLAVLVASRHRPPTDRTPTQIALGIVLGIVAMGTMAWAIVVVTPLIRRYPLVPITTLRMAAGLGGLVLFMLLSGSLRTHLGVFRPTRVWRTAVPAALLGTYFSILFWTAGFKYTYTSVAAVLNQTSAIMACVLAAIFLHERLLLRHYLALAAAICGVLLVQFVDPAQQAAWLQALQSMLRPEQP